MNTNMRSLISIILNLGIAILAVPVLLAKMYAGAEERDPEDDITASRMANPNASGFFEIEKSSDMDFDISIDSSNFEPNDSSSGYGSELDGCVTEFIRTQGTVPRPTMIRRGTVKKNLRIFENCG